MNGLYYKDLKITFKDGMIEEYSCANFPDEEDGQKFIKENLLYNRETLPIGECAIGTNTTAYVMAEKYGIMSKLPILIAEKMGRISQSEIPVILIAKMFVYIIRMGKKS